MFEQMTSDVENELASIWNGVYHGIEPHVKYFHNAARPYARLLMEKGAFGEAIVTKKDKRVHQVLI